MKLKTLLLGSATAMLVGGAAQAADLSVAEPVDYVRVCDAFGVGYWYIPGTDTCLKLGGNVKFDAYVFSDSEDGEDYWQDIVGSNNHYHFQTEIYLTMNIKSMTDWGPLEGFLALYGFQSGKGDGSYFGNGVAMDEAWISIGPLLAGYTRTLMMFGRGGYASMFGNGHWFNAEHQTNTVRISWAMNGFGLAVALEQPNYHNYYYDYDGYSTFPDVIAALTFSNAMFDAKVSAVYSDFWAAAHNGTGYAIAAGVIVKLDSIAPGDKLLLKAAYGTALPFVVAEAKYNSPLFLETDEPAWSVMVSFLHYFNPTFWASITANWASGTDSWDDDERSSAFQAEFALGYEAAPNFWIKPSVRWISTFEDYGPQKFSDWIVNLRLQRDFGDK